MQLLPTINTEFIVLWKVAKKKGNQQCKSPELWVRDQVTLNLFEIPSSIGSNSVIDKCSLEHWGLCRQREKWDTRLHSSKHAYSHMTIICRSMTTCVSQIDMESLRWNRGVLDPLCDRQTSIQLCWHGDDTINHFQTMGKRFKPSASALGGGPNRSDVTWKQNSESDNA